MSLQPPHPDCTCWNKEEQREGGRETDREGGAALFMSWQWKRMTSAPFRGTTSLTIAGHIHREKLKKSRTNKCLVKEEKGENILYRELFENKRGNRHWVAWIKEELERDLEITEKQKRAARVKSLVKEGNQKNSTRAIWKQKRKQSLSSTN